MPRNTYENNAPVPMDGLQLQNVESREIGDMGYTVRRIVDTTKKEKVDNTQQLDLRGNKEIIIEIIPTKLGRVVTNIEEINVTPNIPIFAGEVVNEKTHTIRTVNGDNNINTIADSFVNHGRDFNKSVTDLRQKFLEHERVKNTPGFYNWRQPDPNALREALAANLKKTGGKTLSKKVRRRYSRRRKN